MVDEGDTTVNVVSQINPKESVFVSKSNRDSASPKFKALKGSA
jgi:hypothetical protein